jgi:hypothetical protein
MRSAIKRLAYHWSAEGTPATHVLDSVRNISFDAWSWQRWRTAGMHPNRQIGDRSPHPEQH